jgi:hypothetical protein
MLKRGGRRHDLMGIGGTQNRELAMLCPPCPHSGINLLEGWEGCSD